MDRISLSSCFRFKNGWSVLLPSVLLLAGCGGSADDGAPAAPDAPAAVDAPGDPSSPSSEPGPSKPITGGLTLPGDDLPDAPAKRAKPGEGGMKLPDNMDLGASEISGGGSVPLTFADWSEVQTAAKTTGRVTVLDVWSLACGPCLKEFPNLVELQERYGDRVAAIGANVDFTGRKTRPPEYFQPKVSEFLQSVEATFANYIVQTPDEDVFAAMGVGSIPAVLVFDAQGELVRTFSDSGATAGFTYEADIVPLVEQLLRS